MNKRWCFGALAVLAMMASAGCAKGANDAKTAEEPAKPAEPVTLTVLQQAEISDEDFQLLFADPVKKKYPNITLKLVRTDKGVTLDNLIASGEVPDILTPPNADILGLSQKDILYDMAPLVKASNLDLSRFDPLTIQAVQSDKGELWGLPYAMQFNALYYNKDLFDKFGVSYPKDGMTWDDAIELGKKLTRAEDGVQYRGLDPVSSYILSFPFALTFVDSKTERASINNEQWKKVWELTHTILSIPGNALPKPEPGAATEGNFFIKDKNVAMLASTNLMAQIGTAASGVNWDIAQYPSYKELPGITGKLDTHNLAISKTSPHKEEAMKVLEVVTSDEVQLISARKTARKSPLKNPQMQKEFGADVPYLQGKNTGAIFKGTVAPAPAYSKYELDGKKIAQAKVKEYLAGNIDLNTALKQADEEINSMLDSMK
jgi:multiple sugar transport system substrate-binding protein